MEDYSLLIEANGQTFDIEIGQFCYTPDDIRESIRDQVKETQDEDDTDEDEETPDPWEDDFEYKIKDFGELPEFLQEQELETFGEIIEARDGDHLDLDIWEAGIYCGISVDDIPEAYSGSFKSDEDFAQEMAEQMGAIDRELNWPYTCIDWEQAAQELMYDYSEHKGHYFRNF